MLTPISPQPTTPLLKEMARFAERRQDVLAGNIANIDTPGYRTRDLPTQEFCHALNRAVARLQSEGASSRLPEWMSLAQGTTHLTPQLAGGAKATEASIQDMFPERLFQAITPAEQSGITFQDGNNRGLEHQFLEMTKNRLWQNFALELLRGQYDQLQAVIAERP